MGVDSNAQTVQIDRVGRLLRHLSALVAGQGLAAGLAGPLIVLICTRLRRLSDLFAATAARPLTPPRAKRQSSRPRRQAPPAPRPLPCHAAWLLRLLPATAGAAGGLHQLLAEPDMIALIESRPATGRALRPLCHMLGIAPPPSLRRRRTPPAAPRSAPRSAPPSTGPAPKPRCKRHARRRERHDTRPRKPGFMPWLSPALSGV